MMMSYYIAREIGECLASISPYPHPTDGSFIRKLKINGKLSSL
jgi:hypothetical protein